MRIRATPAPWAHAFARTSSVTLVESTLSSSFLVVSVNSLFSYVIVPNRPASGGKLIDATLKSFSGSSWIYCGCHGLRGLRYAVKIWFSLFHYLIFWCRRKQTHTSQLSCAWLNVVASAARTEGRYWFLKKGGFVIRASFFSFGYRCILSWVSIWPKHRHEPGDQVEVTLLLLSLADVADRICVCLNFRRSTCGCNGCLIYWRFHCVIRWSNFSLDHNQMAQSSVTLFIRCLFLLSTDSVRYGSRSGLSREYLWWSSEVASLPAVN